MTDQLDHLYTPLEEAVALLHERRKALSGDSGSALERHLSSKSYAVIFRQIASPNFELERFASLASSVGLVPLVLEFPADRFITFNPSKCALVRMRFSDGPDSATAVSKVVIADMSSSDSLPFRQIRTAWNQPLVSFHHELLFSRAALRSIELFDASEWFLVNGPKANDYYPRLLSLFVHHAILFDDFLMTPSEQRFTTEVVASAFESAHQRHKLRPLVCRIDPTDGADQNSWFHYPNQLKELVVSRTQMERVSVQQCELGRGVFAERSFKPGERIMRLSGRALTFNEAQADHFTSFNMLQVAPRLYLDLDSPSVFINHSCEPNAGIVDDLFLTAICAIAPGDEIRYDYSTTMSDNSTMDCACGSDGCRQQVNDFDTLPVERRQHYLSCGIVLSFISSAFKDEPNA